MQLKPQTKWLEITGENSYVQPTDLNIQTLQLDSNVSLQVLIITKYYSKHISSRLKALVPKLGTLKCCSMFNNCSSKNWRNKFLFTLLTCNGVLNNSGIWYSNKFSNRTRLNKWKQMPGEHLPALLWQMKVIIVKDKKSIAYKINKIYYQNWKIYKFITKKKNCIQKWT